MATSIAACSAAPSESVNDDSFTDEALSSSTQTVKVAVDKKTFLAARQAYGADKLTFEAAERSKTTEPATPVDTSTAACKKALTERTQMLQDAVLDATAKSCRARYSAKCHDEELPCLQGKLPPSNPITISLKAEGTGSHTTAGDTVTNERSGTFSIEVTIPLSGTKWKNDCKPPSQDATFAPAYSAVIPLLDPKNIPECKTPGAAADGDQ